MTLKIKKTGSFINIFNIYAPQLSGRIKELCKKLKGPGQVTSYYYASVFIEDYNYTISSRERLQCVGC